MCAYDRKPHGLRLRHHPTKRLGHDALDAPDQFWFDRRLTAMMRGFQQFWQREQLRSFAARNFFREVDKALVEARIAH